MNTGAAISKWPPLDYYAYGDTVTTVQLWTQIVGKIRLLNSPWTNHSWHVSLYVNARGLTTGAVPYPGGIFEMAFDFISHQLVISSSLGEQKMVALYPRTVADFYNDVLGKLGEMLIDADIHPAPNEVNPAIPFADDKTHQTYDAVAMQNLWQTIVRVNNVFTRFRARFTGKCSPVHFFWGAFDLAVTRFSGRPAPVHPGGAPNMPLAIMQEAYSHEVSSCGFWPGNADFPQAVFYSYCYPTPKEFATQRIEQKSAFYNTDMGEFMLPYEAVQKLTKPETALLKFLQSTYEAAANTGHWDRSNLECDLTRFEK